MDAAGIEKKETDSEDLACAAKDLLQTVNDPKFDNSEVSWNTFNAMIVLGVNPSFYLF